VENNNKPIAVKYGVGQLGRPLEKGEGCVARIAIQALIAGKTQYSWLSQQV
jgi:hypothetical protein